MTWTMQTGPNSLPSYVAFEAGRELFRIVPQSASSFRLERRDGAFWWPLLGAARSKHGVPLPRVWRSAQAAMRAAPHAWPVGQAA